MAGSRQHSPVCAILKTVVSRSTVQGKLPQCRNPFTGFAFKLTCSAKAHGYRKATRHEHQVLVIAAALVTMPATGAFAQATYHQRHSINASDARQQARINKGVANGQFTPKGAAAADAHQAHLNAEQANMRAADGGHLTGQDRHKLARQQDRTSQHIYNRNHNAATDPGVAPR